MNPERPRSTGDNSNVIDFAKEKAKREEAEEIIEQGSSDSVDFNHSHLPLIPPITADELESLPSIPPRDD